MYSYLFVPFFTTLYYQISLSVRRSCLHLIVLFSLTESSEHEDKSTDASGEVPVQPCPPETPTLTATDAPEEEGEAPKSPQDSQENDELDPLPDNWEMAYTEKGEVYFIEWVKCTSKHISLWKRFEHMEHYLLQCPLLQIVTDSWIIYVCRIELIQFNAVQFTAFYILEIICWTSAHGRAGNVQ